MRNAKFPLEQSNIKTLIAIAVLLLGFWLISKNYQSNPDTLSSLKKAQISSPEMESENSAEPALERDFRSLRVPRDIGAGYFYTETGCCGEDSRVLIKMGDHQIDVRSYGSAPPCEESLKYSFNSDGNLSLQESKSRCFIEKDTNWIPTEIEEIAHFEIREAYLDKSLEVYFPLPNEMEEAKKYITPSVSKTEYAVYLITTNRFKKIFTQISAKRYKDQVAKYRQWVKTSQGQQKESL